MPGTRVEGYVIACTLPPDQLVACEKALRQAPTAVITRVNRGKLLIDLRTVFEHQESVLLETLAATLARIETANR